MQIFLLLIFLNVDFYNFRSSHQVEGVMFYRNNTNICSAIDCSKIGAGVFEKGCGGFHFQFSCRPTVFARSLQLQLAVFSLQSSASGLQLYQKMNSFAVSFQEFCFNYCFELYLQMAASESFLLLNFIIEKRWFDVFIAEFGHVFN